MKVWYLTFMKEKQLHISVLYYGNGEVHTLTPEENPIEKRGGRVYWNERAGDQYVITGVEKSGKRFRVTSSSWGYIKSVNACHGTRWLMRNGKKWKIQSV